MGHWDLSFKIFMFNYTKFSQRIFYFTIFEDKTSFFYTIRVVRQDLIAPNVFPASFLP